MPQSFFEAAAKNEVLQIVFFAIIFAVALSQVQGPAKTFMLSFCESLSEVMFKFVGIVMKFAPIGIGAAIAVTVGKSGLGVLQNLGVLVLTLYGALIVFVLFVLLPIALMFKVPIRRFWQATKEPWLIAFTTASSEAALPLALQQHGEARRAAAHRLVRAAHRATRSTSTAPRSISRSRRCSSRRRRASTCRSRSRS